MVDEFDAVEIRTIAPVALARAQGRLLAYFDLGQLEGAGPERARTPLAAVLRMQDEGGIVEQILRNGELRYLRVQANRMVVHLLDRVGIPQRGRHDRIALVVLLAGIDVLQLLALHPPLP